jgi:hypothetical protein
VQLPFIRPVHVSSNEIEDNIAFPAPSEHSEITQTISGKIATKYSTNTQMSSSSESAPSKTRKFATTMPTQISFHLATAITAKVTLTTF